MRFILALLTVLLIGGSICAAEFDPRAAFGSVPGRDLDAALKRAEKENKRVFLAFYDPKGDYNDQGLQIKYFTDLVETKKLLKTNFVVVLLPRGHKDLAKYTASMNTERPRFILLSPKGDFIKDDTLAQNPEWGLKIVQALVALP